MSPFHFGNYISCTPLMVNQNLWIFFQSVSEYLTRDKTAVSEAQLASAVKFMPVLIHFVIWVQSY